jgi:hypothetical protein
MELIVANVGWGVGVLIAYDLHMAMSLPLIIVGEAIVLWGVLPRHSFWRSLWLSLGYSLVMNLFSGLLGLVSGRFWMGLVDPALRVYPSAYYYTPPAGGIETLWFKLTVAFGALSVADSLPVSCC